MKKILVVLTGGTIASAAEENVIGIGSAFHRRIDNLGVLRTLIGIVYNLERQRLDSVDGSLLNEVHFERFVSDGALEVDFESALSFGAGIRCEHKALDT